MDVAPAILELAGLEVPGNWEAKSMLPLATGGGEGDFRDAVYAELARDHIQPHAEYLIMRRDRDWKIVVYPGEGAGELYDLQADPGEDSQPLVGPGPPRAAPGPRAEDAGMARACRPPGPPPADTQATGADGGGNRLRQQRAESEQAR